MLNKKEVKEILIKFAEKCTRINPDMRYNECLKIGRDIVFDTGIDDIRLLILSLNYEIVKLKRMYHIPIVDKRDIEPTSIEEFIKKIDSKVVREIRKCRNAA
jgi:hypothetical protein